MASFKGKAVIGQSGGPTCVINQTLVGALLEAGHHPEIQAFYGARHGVHGMLQEDFIDLRAESSDTLEAVARTPSAALGSVRKRPTEEDCQRLIEVFRSRDIRYFFYIGGNDSAETADIVSKRARETAYELRVVHLPKTIDNDLRVTDHCPGYGSAARFVALALMGDTLDNRALAGVKIDVIMGRHAGFLTAASALGRRDEDDGPHLIYLPEIPFDLDRFLGDVERVLRLHGRCVVAVSEGIAGPDGKPVFQCGETDAHGNVQLSGSGALGDFLAAPVRSRLGVKRVRADTFGYLQRCFPTIVSPIDAAESRAIGAFAVREIVRGDRESGSAAIRRLGSGKDYSCEFFFTELSSVARETRPLGKEFIAPAGNDVTPAFIDYALPLIGELPTLGRLRARRVSFGSTAS
ncbi:MAG: 6-phosphofructokinase [Planctomycetes bacterium]|nr:6-phosphofructokinase [Planctomycetota bacterium]